MYGKSPCKAASGYYTGSGNQRSCSYADAGQDLVCAGVSSIAVGMMNALDEMVPEACDFVLKEAYIKIETILPDATAGILLQGMYYQLSTMQESYADYITINDQEV